MLRWIIVLVLLVVPAIAQAQQTETFSRYMSNLPRANTPLSGNEIAVILQNGSARSIPFTQTNQINYSVFDPILVDPYTSAKTGAALGCGTDASTRPPGFFDFVCFNLNHFYYHGDHSTNSKDSLIGLFENCVGPGASQHFCLQVFSTVFGAGDHQSVSPFLQWAGGLPAGGDEGANVNAVELQELTSNSSGNIISNSVISGGTTTLALPVVGSNIPQIISLTSSTGFSLNAPLATCPDANGRFGQGNNVPCGWAVIAQTSNYNSNGLNVDAVAYIAVGTNTITGYAHLNQNSGVAVTPATIFQIQDNSGTFGEHRYLQNLSRPSYSIGTVTYDTVNSVFNCSGCAWTNGMVGGNSSRIGAIAASGYNNVQGARSWFNLSNIVSPTQVAVENSASSDLPLVNTVTIGGTTFNNGDTVSLIFTNSNYPGWPVTITYTLGNGETATTVASGLVSLIQASGTLYNESLFSANASGVITISQAMSSNTSTVITSSVTGTGNETVTRNPVGGTLTGTSYQISPDALVLRVIPVGQFELPTSLWLVLETNNFNWVNGDSVEQANGPSLRSLGQRIQEWMYWPAYHNNRGLQMEYPGGIIPTLGIEMFTDTPAICPTQNGAIQCDAILANFNNSPGQVRNILTANGSRNFANVLLANGMRYVLDSTGMTISGGGGVTATSFGVGSTPGVSCAAGTVSMATLTITAGIVTHC